MEHNTIVNRYLSDNERYADLINGCEFGGKLYYGDEWDGSHSLHELLDFTDIPEQLKSLVNDYSIHLIEIKRIPDTSVFRTDLKQVFDFMRYSEDKKKLRELVEKDAVYQRLDEDAYDMVALYTKSTELLEAKNKQEGEGINMCRAIKEMLQDERIEGREEGREEERQNTQKAHKAIVDLCREFGATREQTIQQLMDKCTLDRTTAEKLVG